MSRTISISIPLVLLGRWENFNPLESTIVPLDLIYETLHRFCPNIRVLPFALDIDSPPSLSSADESWAALGAEQSATWILRPAPCANEFLSPFDVAQGWQKGDAQLTSDEVRKLGRGVWSCGFLLERFGIPSDSSSVYWKLFVQELHQIFGMLKRAFVEFEGPVKGAEGSAKYWDLVSGDRCFLRITTASMDMEVAKRLIILHAAFEQELDALKTAKEVVRFASASRWLEGTLLRRLTQEKKGTSWIWRMIRFGQETESSKITGRQSEWWDTVYNMDIEEMIEEMTTSENNGLRLGVSLREVAAGMAQVTVQGQRTSLDPANLVAYTELVAHFVHTAEILTSGRLNRQLEQLHLGEPKNITWSFASMLDYLTQDRGHISQYLYDRLFTHALSGRKMDVIAQHASGPLTSPTTDRDGIIDPFYSIRISLVSNYRHSKAEMVGFIERYSKAGGYQPTPKEKLRTILAARSKET
ncbi:hypothetical protein E8E13_007137 [Curvularia kusanoi]|uniref:Uncharacterized protein n=1 Tax=Curvularia kusanoi TaxID=90978 RepID=A0A9P4TGY1_CURKU|nr:hypothetical protein E8E13_007137 [Curvularia kusanoi]